MRYWLIVVVHMSRGSHRLCWALVCQKSLPIGESHHEMTEKRGTIFVSFCSYYLALRNPIAVQGSIPFLKGLWPFLLDRLDFLLV